MRRLIASFSLLAAALGVTSLAAQDVPDFPQPTKEHEWLEQFAGKWESRMTARMGPDQPAVECQGTMNSRMLGGFWVVNEMNGQMMEMPTAGIQTIGYDPQKKKYVGTWVDSMTSHLWRYEGTVDESGKKLTLEAEGPNYMVEGERALFRDAYEFKSADHIVATSSARGDDGQWITFMEGDLRRKK